MKKQIKELLNNPKNIIPAIKGNLQHLWDKLFNPDKLQAIKTTAEILSKCPKQCTYQLECCGCSIYAAVNENKKCKYSKNTK